MRYKNMYILSSILHKTLAFVQHNKYTIHMIDHTFIKHQAKQLKQERDFLLSQPYIQREAEQDLEKTISSHLIKVITGPRRAGKSTMGLHALKKYNDFVYINFDTRAILETENIYDFIIQLSKEFANSKIMFLDEIQNIKDFELIVSQLNRNGFHIIMTGSNANLLSQELATHLTGRYIHIKVLPFNYQEAKQLRPQLTYLEYLKIGGFPEQLKLAGTAENYLQTLFESIILKDIVARYSIRKTYDLLKLATYLINTPSQNSNYTRIKNKLNMNSTNTLIDFYSYLSEAYLIYNLKTYSYKSSEMIKSDFKTYIIDTGMFTAHSVKFEEHIGHLFENSIFIDLIRKKYQPNRDLFQVANHNKTHVDFYLHKNKKTLIQACISVRDNTTRQREFNAILQSSVEYEEAYVIVLNKEESLYSNEQIQVIGIEDWASL